MSKKYYDTVRVLNDSKFKHVPYKIYCDKDEYSPECEECECESVCKVACSCLSQCTRKGGKCKVTYYHCDEAHNQITKNLLSMFNVLPNVGELTYEERGKTFGGSISDYAWTQEIQDAFWNHPLHRSYCAEMEEHGFAFSTLKLDIEPCLLEDE